MIYKQPIGNIEVVYKWYILPIGGLYGTYHLLREPETTIDKTLKQFRIESVFANLSRCMAIHGYLLIDPIKRWVVGPLPNALFMAGVTHYLLTEMILQNPSLT